MSLRGANRNEAASQLWEQVFARMAVQPDAALIDPDHSVEHDIERIRISLEKAGWSHNEIKDRIEQFRIDVQGKAVNSPGTAPHVEKSLNRLCDDIEAAMQRLGFDSFTRVARGVEPKTGPSSAMLNVTLTDQGIVTVSSFLFRFCGLVARAFTRTLHLNPWLWEDPEYSEADARSLLQGAPSVTSYWLSIFVSFAVTGTQIMSQYRPATRMELVLFEQVARAMEIFAIAHEYGHHYHGHGRSLDCDPKDEEFAADQFALRVSYEVERYPEITENPYNLSGAGGMILFLALEILRTFKALVGVRAPVSTTHPSVNERIARFNTVAILQPKEFLQWNGFRTASTRIMTAVSLELDDLLGRLSEVDRAHLRKLAADASADPHI